MLGPEMLTIRAAKGPDYYERAEFARDDYYEERGQVRGSWEGRGAEALGLVGRARRRRPRGAARRARSGSAARCSPAPRAARGGNVAFDLTFTAPKSVSVLAAVGDEAIRQAVLAAQAAGARAGLDYLERRACFVRRGRNGVTVLPGEGFVGAMYLHEMARSGDPHLHAHLVIANRVRGPDGRWSAPDMRPVYAEAKTAGTIAEAVMRDALTRSLGVEWGPVAQRHRRARRRARPRCASTSRSVTPRSSRRRPRAGSPRVPAASTPSSARRATESASSRASEPSPNGAPAPPSTASASASCAAPSAAREASLPPATPSAFDALAHADARAGRPHPAQRSPSPVAR